MSIEQRPATYEWRASSGVMKEAIEVLQDAEEKSYRQLKYLLIEGMLIWCSLSA